MSSQDEQIQQRRANLDELAKLGVEIYPHAFDRRHTISQLVERYASRTREELEAERIDTITSGRILAIRSFGKANFLVLSDGLAKVQVYISATGSASKATCSAPGPTSSPSMRRGCTSWPSACCRYRRNGTASPTSRSVTASVTSI
jgi:lysyl-tRNA synthetase class II